MHHSKTDKGRLYLPRSEGGRSVIQIELAYKTTTQDLQTTKDWMMELVRKNENNKKLYSVAKKSRKYMTELNIEERNHELGQQMLQKK